MNSKIIIAAILFLNLLFAQGELFPKDQKAVSYGIENSNEYDRSMLQLGAGYTFNSWFSAKVKGYYGYNSNSFDNAFGAGTDLTVHYTDEKVLGSFTPYLFADIYYLRGTKDSPNETITNMLNLKTGAGVIYKYNLNEGFVIHPRFEIFAAGAWKTEETIGITASAYGNVKSTPDFGYGFRVGNNLLYHFDKKNIINLDINYRNIEGHEYLNYGISYIILL